jgi:hypothetical protein
MKVLFDSALSQACVLTDRDPPRLATLTHSQEEAVTHLLEFLALTDCSWHQDSGCRAIGERWSAGALCRPGRNA